MAKVFCLTCRIGEAQRGHSELEPFAARVVAQGNQERLAVATKANATMKRDRAHLHRNGRSLRDTHEELTRAEHSFRTVCGERRHRKPVPGWAFILFAIVAWLGEWAIAYELLDYLAVRGHPRPEATFASYFVGVGWLEGVAAAFPDYFNEKAVLSLSLAASVLLLAKMTGSRIRQRQAGRPWGMPDWIVVFGNLSFLFFAGAFAVLREAQLAREGVAELTGLWWVFLAVQTFVYVAAVAFSAWTADPDPEAGRLAHRIDQLRLARDRLWRERVAIASRNAEASAKAQDQAAEILHRTLGMIATYRDHNFANRPAGDPPPDFMRAAVGEEVFVPLPLDPLVDPPGADTRAVVGPV